MRSHYLAVGVEVFGQDMHHTLRPDQASRRPPLTDQERDRTEMYKQRLPITTKSE